VIRRRTPLKRSQKPLKRSPIKHGHIHHWGCVHCGNGKVCSKCMRCRCQAKPMKRKPRKTGKTKDGRIRATPAEMAKLREFIYQRDDGICQLSGVRVERDVAVLDHIKKCKMGGGFRHDTKENLRLAHPYANNLREAGYDRTGIQAVMVRMGYMIVKK
jgi:hypothetical protein